MNRTLARTALVLVSLAGLVASCADHDSVVVVNVSAASGLPAIAHLHATLSNGGLGDEKTFPGKGVSAVDAGVSLPTSFSLTLPHARSGALDIAIDALDENGAVVANGDGTVPLEPGDRVELTIALRPGASLCGNGVVDSGEACDDGDRISSGTCDFRCQLRNATTGAGGRGGAGGATGASGAGGTTGAGGTGGTTGRGGAGAAGATGAAGTGGGPAGAGGGPAGTGGGSAGSSGGGTGGGACSVELLANGAFDSGDTGWTSVTSGRALIYDYNSPDLDQTLAPAPVSPAGFAWLGYDVVSETVLLKQPIQIPPGTLSLSVSGYVQIWTNDDPNVAYDLGYAEILVGSFAQEVDHWSNVDQGTDWTPFSQNIDTTGVAGATATFQLRVKMDDGADTSFFFDSLSVIAKRCP
jgi:cysteine-rich repeat protein